MNQSDPSAGVSAAWPPGPPEISGSYGGLGDLRLVGRQVRFEQLSFWRNPLAAFFTVGFSLVFLVLLGTTAGSTATKTLDGIKLIQYYVPGFVAYGVMAACFTVLATNLVVRRETGLLKRLRLSPVPTWVLMSAMVLSTLVIAVLQVVLVLVVGRLAFHVQMPQDYGPLAVSVAVGALSFSALGIAMSTVIPNQEAAGPIVSIVFFVLLFLSGLWFPFKSTSALARFSDWFPIRHFILAVFAPFDPRPGVSPWAWHDLLIVALWGAAGAVVAYRRFRWAPWRG